MLTEDEERLKAAYVEARGYWTPWTEGLLRHSPAFLEAYAAYGAYPAAHGPLPPVTVELLYVALDASATHLFEPGLRLHAGLALRHGATPGQVIGALQLGAAQGLEGTQRGLGILAEELAALDGAVPEAPPTAAQQALRADWEARFGDWPGFCAVLLRLDPGYLRAVFDMLAAAPRGGGLDAEQEVLLSLGLSACFTAFNPEATRRHIRRALALGLDRRAILQVLQMTAHLGVHACALGVPALLDALGAPAPPDAMRAP